MQRRAIRLIVSKKKGDVLKLNELQFQRPCPDGAISVNDINKIIGKKLSKDIENGDCLRREDIVW